MENEGGNHLFPSIIIIINLLVLLYYYYCLLLLVLLFIIIIIIIYYYLLLFQIQKRVEMHTHEQHNEEVSPYLPSRPIA